MFLVFLKMSLCCSFCVTCSILDYYCTLPVTVIEVDTGKVRNRFGGMGRFNGWVKGRVNGVITHTAGVY